MAEPQAEPKGHEKVADGPGTGASESSRNSESQEKTPAHHANGNDLEANGGQDQGQNEGQDEAAQGDKPKRLRLSNIYKKHSLAIHILIWLIWTA